MQEKVNLPEELLLKYIKGELKEEERIRLDDWLSQDEQHRALFTYITSDRNLEEELKKFRAGNPEAVRAKLIAEWPAVKVIRIRRSAWLAVAAVILIFLSISFLWFEKKKSREVAKTNNEKIEVNGVAPGKFAAKLVLSDGRSIVLDSARQGMLTKQGETEILNEDGKLIYKAGTTSKETLYNTLTTSKGEMYATVLADGSKVWLNSASSIRYPVTFNGNTREITTTGECYYEIAKDPKRPFIVQVGNVKVQVLGTHFNIDAYQDDAKIRTTLLEGSVKIIPADGGNATTLKPGQQAQVTEGAIKIVKNANIEEAVAWKNGLFVFDRTNIQVIMRQIERWYDLQTVYESEKVKKWEFNGEISRYSDVSKVLDLLAATDAVRFSIQDRRIIVSSK